MTREIKWGGDMDIHNYTEDTALTILDDLLAKSDDICKCEKCRLDIIALALNKLPPKYVVTPKGRIYTKLEELQLQLRADIVKELTKAMGRVKAKPYHSVQKF